MAEYNNEMRGVLFRNTKKEGKQPDYRGEITVEGRKLELAGWVKSSQKGVTYLSLNVSYPRENPQGQQQQQRPPQQQEQTQQAAKADLPF